jgi:hypothetical protein
MDKLMFVSVKRKVVRELENNIGPELADETLAEFLIEMAKQHENPDEFTAALTAVSSPHKFFFFFSFFFFEKGWC